MWVFAPLKRRTYKHIYRSSLFGMIYAIPWMNLFTANFIYTHRQRTRKAENSRHDSFLGRIYNNRSYVSAHISWKHTQTSSSPSTTTKSHIVFHYIQKQIAKRFFRKYFSFHGDFSFPTIYYCFWFNKLSCLYTLEPFNIIITLPNGFIEMRFPWRYIYMLSGYGKRNKQTLTMEVK